MQSCAAESTLVYSWLTSSRNRQLVLIGIWVSVVTWLGTWLFPVWPKKIFRNCFQQKWIGGKLVCCKTKHDSVGSKHFHECLWAAHMPLDCFYKLIYLRTHSGVYCWMLGPGEMLSAYMSSYCPLAMQVFSFLLVAPTPWT